jgi:hypothetical protein
MLSTIRRRLLSCAGLLAMVLSLHAVVAQVQGAVDLEGRSVGELATAGAQVVVLIFAATDCPISNRYVPEIARLEAEWKPRGVAFWWVFPNPEDTPALVRKHGHDFSITARTLVDTRQELVRLAHVTVTPEAAVFAVKNGELSEVYHGRIDDRYISFGHEHPQATRHELQDAIKAALGGHPALSPAEGPVGCSIIPIASVTPRP